MSKLDKIKCNFQNVINNHVMFDFPNFLRALRESLCLTRQEVMKDMPFHYLKLYHFEIGNFKQMPRDIYIDMLANYYGITPKMLRDKALEYVKTKRNSKDG